jgi:O-antigen/teichoic acid export membrane protein
MNIRRQGQVTFATKVLAAATSYGFAILLARVMTPDGFGQVAFFLNAAALLSVLGAVGQQIAMVRFVPPLLAWGDRDHALPELVGAAYCKAILGSFSLYAIAVGLAVAGVFRMIDPVLAIVGFALIPAMGWIDIQSHLARGFQRLPLSMIPKEVLWRGLAGLLILGTAMQSGPIRLAPSRVLALLLVVLLLLALIQGKVLQRTTGFRPRFRWRCDRDQTQEWAATTVPFWITSVSNVFLANADVIAVALFIGPAEAGIYFAANRLAQLLAFFVVSQNIVIGPQLAQAWAPGNRAAVAAILRRSTRATTLPTLAMGAGMLAGAPWILALFGPQFGSAIAPLQVLVLASVVNAATGPADIALNMCGHDRAAMRVSAINLTIATLALGVGAAFGGAFGVALAVLAATVVRKAMYWFVLRRAMGLRSDVFAPDPV